MEPLNSRADSARASRARRPLPLFLAATFIGAFAAVSFGNQVGAQDTKPAVQERRPRPAANTKASKPPQRKRALAEPENLRLPTKDGVPLNCRYFAGSEGKQTVPVILIHGWEGNLANFEQLARTLQAEGHAVIVPDLRGHGESLRQLVPGREEGVELKRSAMRKGDFINMVRYDLDAVKKFLISENNKGELNIELLAVIGSEMGALIAINWTARDWDYPSLPTYKQGQDVKAFILISPPQSFRGLTMREALAQRNVRADLSALILFGGRDSRAAGSARRVHNSLKKFHKQEFDSREESTKNRDLYFYALDTSLQGTKLLEEDSLGVDKGIALFLKRRLVDRNELFPWAKREKPFGN